MAQCSIEQLHNKYKSSLAFKAEYLANLRQATVKSDSDKDYQLLRDSLHKLGGSAGMYGYDDISQLAKQIIKNLDQEPCNKGLIFDDLHNLIDLLMHYYND